MEKTKELNLQEILYAVLNKIWLVILAAIIGGMGMFIYTSKFVTPMYRTSITMYVNNSSKLMDKEEIIEYIASSDLATSERLVTTYVTILQSDKVLEPVCESIEEEHDLRVSPALVRGCMSAGAINETEVFRVTISHPNPKVATIIANTIADVSPDVIGEVVEGSSTKVIDRAKQPTAPYSPNVTQNTMLGIVGGILVAIIIIGATVLMDVRVRSEEDLARLSEAAVLGVIPDFDVEEEKGYSYHAKKNSEISEVGSK